MSRLLRTQEDSFMYRRIRLAGIVSVSMLVAGMANAQTPLKPSNERKLTLPETPYRYADVELPAHFNTPTARRLDNTPRDNPTTDNGAMLGRVLFYDTRLSSSN